MITFPESRFPGFIFLSWSSLTNYRYSVWSLW